MCIDSRRLHAHASLHTCNVLVLANVYAVSESSVPHGHQLCCIASCLYWHSNFASLLTEQIGPSPSTHHTLGHLSHASTGPGLSIITSPSIAYFHARYVQHCNDPPCGSTLRCSTAGVGRLDAAHQAGNPSSIDIIITHHVCPNIRRSRIPPSGCSRGQCPCTPPTLALFAAHLLVLSRLVRAQGLSREECGAHHERPQKTTCFVIGSVNRT